VRLLVLGLSAPPVQPGPVYRHVSFDLDGTLVDSRADLAAAVNHVLGELGRPALPSERLQGFVGDGARQLVERALGTAAPAALVEHALARFLDRYGQHLLDTTRPYPGVRALLEALGMWSVALSVLTNKPEGMSRALLDGLGLARHFVAVVGGDSLPTRKPDPAGVEHLLPLGGTSREEMLLVGDSGIDVRTARAAGIAFCGVAWGLCPDGMWAEAPERVIDDPADLLHVVDGA
jgi:phosphoglycolate phosphatase